MLHTTLFPHAYRKWGWIVLIPGLLLGIAFMIFDLQFDFMKVPVISLFENLNLWSVFTSENESRHTFIEIRKDDISNEIIGLMILAGALLVAFSREKVEDEFMSQLRLSALLWAVYVNAVIQVFGFIFFYEFAFMYFMMTNLFAVLLLFIGRYHYLLHKMRSSRDEE